MKYDMERKPTYGEWVRAQPLDRLSSDERERLEAERVWEQQHPAEVRELDLLVGRQVEISRRLETVAGSEAPDGFVATAKEDGKAPLFYPEGSGGTAEARLGDRLLVYLTAAHGYVLLKLNQVRLPVEKEPVR